MSWNRAQLTCLEQWKFTAWWKTTRRERLTDPVDIAKAILAVSSKGVPADRLLPELMKIFYVDLDQFNAVYPGGAG